ncbi:unnamed protein product [Bursaphelenchus okinawaensis]|uniref:Coatomer subunit delta n=1 Tax=Bursaphelenchus okinawaensis TaxID=465554 RepID=A0A811KTG8_9BILA|nr:unnamed protein product [Bursaphelenchus okinawaensis]CAG9112082.1 unnamed protein product [Bursaphelenchus okinawaensis]
MVLIAASIYSKSGKLLLCRTFVSEMTRGRLQGLVDTFPKLVIGEKNQKEHTYVETDSVRYVYQPMDKIYLALITTKTSNIMEDLDCLRLFARIIPEYCRSNDESEVFNNVFELIAAFDEVVVLGYRESVNLAQIRTFTEMDSHEERIFNQIQIAQQKQAKNNMLEKAKEMKMKKKAMGGVAGGFQGGFGRTSASSGTAPTASASFKAPIASSDFGAPSSEAFKPKPKVGGTGKALKLGAKSATEDSFLQQLRQEGQVVTETHSKQHAVDPVQEVAVHREPVHIKLVEKITAQVPRGGGLKSAEVQGNVSLNISDPNFNTTVIAMKNNNNSEAQLQVHPNLDKKIWQAEGILKLKNLNKPFPPNTDVGVLKWRLPLQSEDELPLSVVCWPNETGNGVTVNVEYTLEKKEFSLENVKISIPLPPSTAPIVSECEGDYEYLKSKNTLLWSIPSIDDSNSNGTLEFEVANGDSEHFFPVNVVFSSPNLFVELAVTGAHSFEGQQPVQYSTETKLVTDNYQIL